MLSADPMTVVYACADCKRPLAWLTASLIGTEQHQRFVQQCQRLLDRCADCVQGGAR